MPTVLHTERGNMGGNIKWKPKKKRTGVTISADVRVSEL